MLHRTTETTLSIPGCGTGLLRVFETARCFLACRARAAALADGSIPVGSLAAAIERDVLAFDLPRAERALREAVIAIDPDFAFAGTIGAGCLAAPDDAATPGCPWRRPACARAMADIATM
ncbi:hypothetical protein GCM10011504_23610 [Siccirubricoccus deserti]|uniref:Uncharacterized protein n=1 Tax=Siccirubricoccus deserti TaxID=2013562 RepID=A0A9X0QYV2_9PROT|nr:hypothetical protein [Siccirubricoccus deserti]MBC4015773.1 hypothetical protein [Siccirubricoccus deserti]GGC44479.1 hypothetical protein GCM10011504_23610 [Siccirubricoccus deserti]